MQQRKATSQAAEATTRQAQLQTRLNDINARRAMIQQQREARIRRAQVLTETAGGGLGIGGTSSSVGAIGAVTTQEATNVGNIRQQGDFGRAIGEAGTEAYTAMGEAKGWSQIGGIAGNIFADTGGFRLLPCALALARPLALRPPLGSCPSLRCHAGVLAIYFFFALPA